MNKSSVFVVGGIAVALLALTLWLVNSGSDDPKKAGENKYVSSNWEKKFDVNSKDPLGLNLFTQVLDNYHSDSLQVARKSLPQDLEETQNTYFFVGDYFVLKEAEFDSILEQVEQGDNLFISCWEMGENMHIFFFKRNYYEWYYGSSMKVFSDANTYEFQNIYQNDTIARKWKLFDESIFKDSTYYVLSSAMETPNFVELAYGDGYIYLHSNPELFYNYQLLSNDGFKHAKNMMSLFPSENKAIWLELGNYYHLNYIFNDEGNGNEQENSLLSFIFKNKALLIAFLLILLGILLYFIFHSKRMQPIVPYIPPAKNRSVAFAQTMKEIYFQQSSPYNLLQVMKKNFFVAINKQFFIDLTAADRERNIKLLAEKAGIEEQRILDLLARYETTQAFSVSNDYLSATAKIQRDFYLETGIIKHKLNQHLEAKAREIRYVLWLPALLIVLGFVSIVLGFGLLVSSQGIGIISWPIGIIMALLGIRMLSVPVLRMDSKSMLIYPLVGTKQHVNFDEIIRAEQSLSRTILTLKDGRKVNINHLNISAYDRSVFQLLINSWKIN